MIMDHHTWYQSIDYRELESTTRQQAYQYQSMRFDLYPHSSSSYYQPPLTEHHMSTIMVETRQGSIIKPATLEELSKSVDDRFATNKVEIKEMSSKLDQVLEMMREILDHTVHVHQTPATNEELSNQLVRLEQIGDERPAAAAEELTSDVKTQFDEVMELRMNLRGKCLDTAESVTYRLPKQHQDVKEVQDQQETRNRPEIHELSISTSSKVVLVPTLTEANVVRRSENYRRSENQDMVDDVSVYDIQQVVIETTKENLYEDQGINEHKVFDEMTERKNSTNKEVPCSFYYSVLVNVLIVYDDMFVPEIIDWKVIMNGYKGAHARRVRALVLFPELLRLGCVPNQFTFASLIKAAAAVGNGEICGQQLHALCLKHGHHLDVYVGSALVNMYARCRVDRIDEARLVFDGLASKNEVSWNALITGHTRRNEGDEALKVFVRMQREEYKATHFTYSSIFSACAGTGALEQGKWVHAYMIKSGGELKAYVGNTLIDMYAKSGSVDDTQKVFDRLLQRDAVSWNSMLTGFAQHGLAKETIRWFEEMLKIGVEPNEVTFLCVLTACSQAGLLDEGQHYFQLMTGKYKIQPDISHYVTMVYLLGRAGHIDQAKQFITEMPIEPTAAVFIALLGVCRRQKQGRYPNQEAHQFRILMLEDKHLEMGRVIVMTQVLRMKGRESKNAACPLDQSPSSPAGACCPNDELS